MPNSAPIASRNHAGGFSQMPIVRSPCTLEWPRTGQAPAPGLPMLPRSSRNEVISRIVATEFLCWVRPIAQHTMTRSRDSTRSVRDSISSREMPLSRVISSHSIAAQACAATSKPSVCSSMNGCAMASRSTSSLLIPANSARSPLTCTGTCRSASWVPTPVTPRTVWGLRNRPSPASRSGLTETTLAPFSLADSSAVSIRGWLVPGFWPTTKIRSECSARSS